MRVVEIVAALDVDPGAVVDATQGALGGGLRPGTFAEGSVADTAAGGLSLVAASDVTSDALASSLQGIAEGASVLLLLPRAAVDLPVGRVVDAVCDAGLQVQAVVPVEHSTHRTAVVVTRSAATAPVYPYLLSRPAVPLDESGVHRVVAEYLVGGLQARAVDAGADSADTPARVAALEKQLAATRARLAAVEGSRAYAGRALSDVRSTPVSGLRKLPGAMRSGSTDPVDPA